MSATLLFSEPESLKDLLKTVSFSKTSIFTQSKLLSLTYNVLHDLELANLSILTVPCGGTFNSLNMLWSILPQGLFPLMGILVPPVPNFASHVGSNIKVFADSMDRLSFPSPPADNTLCLSCRTCITVCHQTFEWLLDSLSPLQTGHSPLCSLPYPMPHMVSGLENVLNECV